MENKEEILKCLSGILKKVEKNLNKNEEQSKLFRSFCYYDPMADMVVLSPKRFEELSSCKGYSVCTSDYNHDAIISNLEEKCDKKTFIAALEITAKDNERNLKITKTLNKLNKTTGKNFNVPKKGEIYISLIQRLYRECASAKNLTIKTSFHNAILDLGDAVAEQYAKLFSEIDEYKKSISIINEMITVISENKHMQITTAKKDNIYNFLKLSEKEKDIINSVISYNEKLRPKSDTDLPIDCPENISYFYEIKENVQDKIEELSEFTNGILAIANVENLDDANINRNLKSGLQNAKNENLTQTVKEILMRFLNNNPKYPQFITVIKPSLGTVVPLTKRRIKEPENFDDVIELFDCYKEILTRRMIIEPIVVNIIDVCLNGIVNELLNVANRIHSKNKVYELAVKELDNIINSLENHKKVVIKNEESFKQTITSLYSSADDDIEGWLSRTINELNEYNKKIDALEIKKARTKAKTIRTNVVNRFGKDGLEPASDLLKTRIKNVSSRDDTLTLLMLEMLMDEPYEKAYQDSDPNYYDLARLAIDCSHYNRINGVYYDEEKISELLSQIK